MGFTCRQQDQRLGTAQTFWWVEGRSGRATCNGGNTVSNEAQTPLRAPLAPTGSVVGRVCAVVLRDMRGYISTLVRG